MPGGVRQWFNGWMARRAFESARGTRRRAAADPLFRAHLERFEADERPVLEALADTGLRVKSLPALINSEIGYTAQIPVLIDWLRRVEYAPVKSTIARALTVREARPAAAPALLEELRRAPGEPPALPLDADRGAHGAQHSDVALLRQALGNALAFTADASYLGAIVELIESPETGSARSALIEGYLGRFPSHREQAIPVLRGLLADDDLGRYALKPLARLRAVQARPEMERFLTHEQDWVRRDAKRALARLTPPT